MREATGDCFEAALCFILDMAIRIAGFDRACWHVVQFELVHAEVVGTGPIEGLPLAHAWVERGPFVFDVANGRRANGEPFMADKARYYKIGGVKLDTVRRYSIEEAAAMASRHGHYGPWDEHLLDLDEGD